MEIDFKYIALSAKNHLPKTEGIYFVLCRNNVLYIGATNNLKNRFHQHHLRYCFSRFKNSYIMWFWKKDSDLELHLIKIFRPLFNQSNLNGYQEKNKFYPLFKKNTIMNKFSTKHWEERMGEITDVAGALAILQITHMTLFRWEKAGIIYSFKNVYNGRLRKCFNKEDLLKLAKQKNESAV